MAVPDVQQRKRTNLNYNINESGFQYQRSLSADGAICRYLSDKRSDISKAYFKYSLLKS